MSGEFFVKEGKAENESLKTPFVSLMNHLSRGGKNVSVARGALWLNFHSFPHFPQNDSTDGDYRHYSFPLPFAHPLPFLSCHVLLTWSASEVDSMLISSRSAVSLHICSHFIFRNLSRSSKITPEGTETKRAHDGTCQPSPPRPWADSAAKTGHEVTWHTWSQPLELLWGMCLSVLVKSAWKMNLEI